MCEGLIIIWQANDKHILLHGLMRSIPEFFQERVVGRVGCLQFGFGTAGAVCMGLRKHQNQHHEEGRGKAGRGKLCRKREILLLTIHHPSVFHPGLWLFCSRFHGILAECAPFLDHSTILLAWHTPSTSFYYRHGAHLTARNRNSLRMGNTPHTCTSPSLFKPLPPFSPPNYHLIVTHPARRLVLHHHQNPLVDGSRDVRN